MKATITLSLNPCFNGRYSLSCLRVLDAKIAECLNPCFNGRYSLSIKGNTNPLSKPSLNPCFNGRYSLSNGLLAIEALRLVLILVLMEDTL